MTQTSKEKWRAVSYTDCTGHIKRMVLVKRGDDWGVRTMWESGHGEVVRYATYHDAYERIVRHPARLGEGELLVCV